jgi:sugar O-acyltransferase (sialic acid O-acetyltransferase NeuD family)
MSATGVALSNQKRQLIIIGAGGHAVSVANVAISAGFELVCFVDASKKGERLLGLPIIADISEQINYLAFDYAIAIGDNASRERVFQIITSRYGSLKFPPIIHATAAIESFSSLGSGSVVMPMAIVGPNSIVGNFCILNTRSSIDHDCIMHDFSSIGPHAVAGGRVSLFNRSAIAIGSSVKHGLTIGSDSILGANSYLNLNLDPNKIAFGNPAKVIRSRSVDDSYLD